MSDPSKIAQEAMRLATSFLDEATSAVLDQAEGDLQALFDASQIVKDHAKGPASSHSAEHLAFSLITAAYVTAKESPDSHWR
jgi:hypothetical protein